MKVFRNSALLLGLALASPAFAQSNPPVDKPSSQDVKGEDSTVGSTNTGTGASSGSSSTSTGSTGSGTVTASDQAMADAGVIDPGSTGSSTTATGGSGSSTDPSSTQSTGSPDYNRSTGGSADAGAGVK